MFSSIFLRLYFAPLFCLTHQSPPPPAPLTGLTTANEKTCDNDKWHDECKVKWMKRAPTDGILYEETKKEIRLLTCPPRPTRETKNKTTTFAINNMVSLHCLSTPTKPLSIPLSHPKPFARLFERWTIRLRLLHAHTHSLTLIETTLKVVVPVCCKRSTMAIEKQQK